MEEFESITLKRLLVFLDAVATLKTMEVSNIKQHYSLSGDKYNEIVKFMVDLSIVKIDGDNLELSPQLKKFIESDERNVEQARNEFILDHLLELKGSRGQVLDEFLSEFRADGVRYACKLPAEKRLNYSDIRNLLMELKFLEIERETEAYYIGGGYLINYLEKRLYQKKISPEELDLQLKLKKELGEEAEKRVVTYEKDRLAAYPELLDRVRQVSKENAAAGYDILSYETLKEGSDEIVERYIEVKAVNRFDFRFYWSKNEIELAKRLGERYYLYLLPTGRNQTFYLSEMQKYQNPYYSVYKNTLEWAQEPESISFSMVAS